MIESRVAESPQLFFCTELRVRCMGVMWLASSDVHMPL